MSDDKHVRELIYGAGRLFGFAVKDVAAAPGKGKRADFVLCDGTFGHIVELKSFLPISPAWLDKSHGGDRLFFSDGRAIPKIFFAVRKAVQQISETKKQPDCDADYGLIWIHVIDEAMCHRVEDAFYGSLAMHFFADPAENKIIPHTVYYANQCIFANEDYRVIDAVVISMGDFKPEHEMSFQLCINSFGTQYEQFKSSPLVRKFRAKGDVLDPIQLDSYESALVVDNIEVPRNTHKPETETGAIVSPEVQEFIYKKYSKIYGSSLQPVTMTVSFELSKFNNNNGDRDRNP